MKITKIDITAIGMILLLLLTSYLALFKGERSKISQLQEQEKILAEKLEAAGNMNMELDKITQDIEQIRENLEAFDRILPGEKRIYDFVRTIDELAQKNNLKLQRIEPGTLEKETLYGRIPIQISAKADFLDLYRFLHRIERIPRITKLGKLHIQKEPSKEPDDPVGNVCRMELTLAVFVSGE